MRIGIDLGGTKTELIMLGHDGAERLRFRCPTPAGDYHATVALIAEMVGRAEYESGARATVGIGTPGSVSLKTGRMKNCNSTCLNGQPLQQDLEHALGRQIRISNDANCFALSEAIDGAAAGSDVMFGVILGTGVGGGLVINQRIVRGCNRIAGEWGHNPLPSPDKSEMTGPACYCGRAGCIERWLSGPGLAEDYKRNGGESISDLGISDGGISDVGISAENIAAAATQGDAGAADALERYCQRLARALAGVINIVDPDVIVLGGGLSGIDLLYDRVPALWHAYIFSDRVDTKLLRPQYGDASGVRGAAWLWE